MLNDSRRPILFSPAGLIIGALILTIIIYKKYTEGGLLNENPLNFIVILLGVAIVIPLAVKYRYYLNSLSGAKFYKAVFLHLLASVIFGLIAAGVVFVSLQYYPNLLK